MHLRLVLLFLACISPSLAWAGGTVSWPNPPVPSGQNSALVPVPNIDWLAHFQKNLDDSRKMAKIDLIFDGDSITQLFPVNGGGSWQRYAKRNVFDFGISGDRIQYLLWRLQNGQVDGLAPRLIVLMIGTNNLGDNTSDEIVAGTKAIIGEYQKRCPNATILLMGILSRGLLPTEPNRVKATAINLMLPALADGKKVIFQNIDDKFVQPDGTLIKEYLQGDLVHPTAKGYAVWADAIQPTIDRFFPQ